MEIQHKGLYRLNWLRCAHVQVLFKSINFFFFSVHQQWLSFQSELNMKLYYVIGYDHTNKKHKKFDIEHCFVFKITTPFSTLVFSILLHIFLLIVVPTAQSSVCFLVPKIHPSTQNFVSLITALILMPPLFIRMLFLMRFVHPLFASCRKMLKTCLYT